MRKTAAFLFSVFTHSHFAIQKLDPLRVKGPSCKKSVLCKNAILCGEEGKDRSEVPREIERGYEEKLFFVRSNVSAVSMCNSCFAKFQFHNNHKLLIFLPCLKTLTKEQRNRSRQRESRHYLSFVTCRSRQKSFCQPFLFCQGGATMKAKTILKQEVGCRWWFLPPDFFLSQSGIVFTMQNQKTDWRETLLLPSLLSGFLRSPSTSYSGREKMYLSPSFSLSPSQHSGFLSSSKTEPPFASRYVRSHFQKSWLLFCPFLCRVRI